MMRNSNVCVYVCLLLLLISALEWQVILSADQGITGSGGTLVYPNSPAPSPAPLIDCKSECNRRCSVALRQKACLKACLKFCGICCNACKCVPSGTRGNKDECPYYRDKRSSQGKPKCP